MPDPCALLPFRLDAARKGRKGSPIAAAIRSKRIG